MSTFSLRRSGIKLESTVDSGGLRPISVTEHDGIVYVRNAAGAGPIDATISANGRSLHVLNGSGQSISSFGINRDGSLVSPAVDEGGGIPGRPTSVPGTAAGLPLGANGLAAN